MTDSGAKLEKKKGKFRFNFIDLLLIALAALFLIGYLGSSSIHEREQSELILTLRLSSHDVLQAKAGQNLPLAGQEVTHAQGTALYGVLEEDYEQGSELLILRVKAQLAGSDPTVGDVRLFVDQRLDLRCGALLCHGAVIENIEEV